MTKTITDPAPIASSGATRRRLQPGEHADSPDGASGTGTTQTPGTGSPRAWSVCLGYSKRARWRFNTPRLAPSPIRTLPSAPEFHRIVLVDAPLARGLYRRSGLGRHSSRPHQTPKAAIERIAMHTPLVNDEPHVAAISNKRTVAHEGQVSAGMT